MKKIFKTLIFSLSLIFILNTSVYASGELNGYSEWSEKKTGDKNEVTAIQYGRKLPLVWSDWSEVKSDSLYQKSMAGDTRHYSYDGEQKTWKDSNAKELFTWDFKNPAKVTYFYADVDTYVSGSWTYYEGPPLQLYCDGSLVGSVGTHDAQRNWNPSINSSCRYLKLTMSSNNGHGRDRTSIVGTWATTTSTKYSHVLLWDNGNDWRFNDSYEELYGEDSQIPTQRVVYSHPITYQITYDLDGGQALGKFTYHYTVLDDVEIPKATKLGYEFVGWQDKDGTMYQRINKGTYKDLHLKAIYKRKDPTLYIGNHEFEQEDKTIKTKELIELVNAKAKDDLDGDITSKIVIESIKYVDDGISINNPSCLDLSKAQKVIIEFSVTNSGDKKIKEKKQFYILGKYEISESEDEDIKIYTRFIDEEYINSLNKDSIWKNDNYKELLDEAFEKMKGE